MEGIDFCDPVAAESAFEWRPVEGAPDGADELVLYRDDDGNCSRFLRVEAGVVFPEPKVHEFVEEVLVLEGGMVETSTGRALQEGTYARHPPGHEHGPFEFPIGCLNFEVR